LVPGTAWSTLSLAILYAWKQRALYSAAFCWNILVNSFPSTATEEAGTDVTDCLEAVQAERTSKAIREYFFIGKVMQQS
jgi:hypothetical protein